MENFGANLLYHLMIWKCRPLSFDRLTERLKYHLKTLTDHIVYHVTSEGESQHGNLLSHENDDNVFTNDWVVFWHINW